MYQGGEIVLGSVATAIEMCKHFGDKYKCIAMNKLYPEHPEWEAIFRRKLQIKVSELIGVTDMDATIQ